MSAPPAILREPSSTTGSPRAACRPVEPIEPSCVGRWRFAVEGVIAERVMVAIELADGASVWLEMEREGLAGWSAEVVLGECPGPARHYLISGSTVINAGGRGLRVSRAGGSAEGSRRELAA